MKVIKLDHVKTPQEKLIELLNEADNADDFDALLLIEVPKDKEEGMLFSICHNEGASNHKIIGYLEDLKFHIMKGD